MPHAATTVWTLAQWLEVVERELLLFALFWFLIGMVDELAVDLIWLGLRLDPRQWAGRRRAAARKGALDTSAPHSLVAVFVPAWKEARVIGITLGQMCRHWPDPALRIYVGCYANDPATLVAAMGAVGADPRVRLVVHDRAGPTTKADCLNRLYRAMQADEARWGRRFGAVVLHDAEDMVHPLSLRLIAQALREADFVQLPVSPALPRGSHWVAGHYCDEFTESHAKALVVRSALGAGLPAAGVGCGFGRAILARIAEMRAGEGEGGPFASACLTEDYELGLIIARLQGRSLFVRQRDAGGRLIATRSYFPSSLPAAVRQKTRWIHGIALQGWDRLGWNARLVDIWMALRDRRGPLTALVLAVAYLLVVVEALLMVVTPGAPYSLPQTPLEVGLMRLAMFGFIWRAAMRFGFTTREYGPLEGLLAVLRIPVGNVIAIMAGTRAFVAYCRSLAGAAVLWDKTEHDDHPALHDSPAPHSGGAPQPSGAGA